MTAAMQALILVVALFFWGCSENKSTPVPSAAPKTTAPPVSSTPANKEEHLSGSETLSEIQPPETPGHISGAEQGPGSSRQHVSGN